MKQSITREILILVTAFAVAVCAIFIAPRPEAAFPLPLLAGMYAVVVLSTVRTSKILLWSIVIPVSAALASVPVFFGMEWISAVAVGLCAAVYPVAYFLELIYGPKSSGTGGSLRRLVRCSLLASYSLLVLLVDVFSALLLTDKGRISEIILVAAVLLGLISLGLCISLNLKRGVTSSLGRRMNLQYMEEKILSSYAQDYLTHVSTSRSVDAIFERLENYFNGDKRPFCDPDLLLSDVAHSVITNKVYLSRAIRFKTGLNFCQYVNRHRIEYAKKLFMENPSLHVNQLALMSGFSSMTTFNSAFHYVEGISPGDWMRVYIQNIKK